MMLSRILGATFFLSVTSFASVFAQGKEPSAKDIYDAYAGYWRAVGANLKRTVEGCQSGDIKGIECFVGPASTGITEIDVRAIDKHGCKVAPSGDGYNCTFTPQVKVSGPATGSVSMFESSLNGSKTNLFRRVSGNWVVSARSDQ